MLTATAVAPAGMPAFPTAVITVLDPAATGPLAPRPLRVSTIRVGATGTNCERFAGGGGAGGGSVTVIVTVVAGETSPDTVSVAV